MKRAVALIGARAGSKGVKDKNIRLLGGHPLMAWTIAVAQKTPEIERLFVCTDTKRYADIARSYGADVIMLPPGVTRDDSSDFDWIINALSQIQPSPDLIAHLRPTTPLRNFNVLNQAIAQFNLNYDSLRSVQRMAETAFKSFMVTPEGKLDTISGISMDEANMPRQRFPETWHPNGYIDILKTEFIIKHQRLHGDSVQAFATQAVIEVDTEEDFERLEYEIGRRYYERPVLARPEGSAPGANAAPPHPLPNPGTGNARTAGSAGPDAAELHAGGPPHRVDKRDWRGRLRPGR